MNHSDDMLKMIKFTLLHDVANFQYSGLLTNIIVDCGYTRYWIQISEIKAYKIPDDSAKPTVVFSHWIIGATIDNNC